MEAALTTREEWQKDGPLYARFEKRSAMKFLQKLQTRIVHTITERATENELLHRRLGYDLAKRFTESINSRWKAPDGLVKDYNKEVRRFQIQNDQSRLRELSVADLKKDGLDCNEIWDIDLLMSRLDWAVHDFVRAGIEAKFRLERVEEERVQLRLHCKRVVRWVDWQLQVLLEPRERLPNSLHTGRLLTNMVLHRYKIISSLTKALAKLPDVLLPEDLERITGLHGRIAELLHIADFPNAPVEESFILPQAEDHSNRQQPGLLDEPAVLGLGIEGGNNLGHHERDRDGHETEGDDENEEEGDIRNEEEEEECDRGHGMVGDGASEGWCLRLVGGLCYG